LPWAAGLAALTAAAVWFPWRRHRHEQRVLEQALGHLAEFRLPLPEGMHEQLPPVLQPLIGGYDRVFVEMQRRQAELDERVGRYAFMEMHSDDMVMQVDAKGLVKYVSPAVHAHLGYTTDEICGMRILDLLHPDELPAWMESLKAAARARSGALLEGHWRRKDGRYLALEMSLRHAYGLNGAVAETIAMGRNVEARNELRDKLTRAALTDHLTGLPNRAALVATLQRFRAVSREKPFVLFLFDLDRFKQVNDTLGHLAGDMALKEIARALRGRVRPTDHLCRKGGDEFLVWLSGADEKRAMEIGEELRKDIAAAALTTESGEPIPISVSVGASQVRREEIGDDVDQVLEDLISRANRDEMVMKSRR